MTFGECVLYCAENRELVENFDRLCGANLSQIALRAPIDRMVDEATGRDDDSMAKFCAFVFECVWTRIPLEIVPERR